MKIEERLKEIKVTKVLCLGTKLSMNTLEILNSMTDKQIIKMFEENVDAQYILLDLQGYIKKPTYRRTIETPNRERT